ncbi:ATP-binding cassette domain-containing protein [Lysinibacillus sphaericus]
MSHKNKLLDKNIYKDSKIKFISVTLLIVITAILNSQLVSFTKKFIDSLGMSNFKHSLILLLSLGAFSLSTKVAEQVITYIKSLIRLTVESQLNHKFLSILNFNTITELETPTYQNEVNYFRGTLGTLSALPDYYIDLGKNLIFVVVYSYLIFQYNWLVLLILIPLAVPNAIFHNFYAKKLRYYYRDTSEIGRGKESFFQLLLSPQTQKENMVFSNKNFLLQKWSVNNTIGIEKQKALMNTEFLWRFLMHLPNVISIMAVQVVIVTGIMLTNKNSIGDYFAIITAAGFLQSSLIGLAEILGRLKEAKLVIKDGESFFEKFNENNLDDTPFDMNKIENVRLDNLSFTYPNMGTEALEDISLTFKIGENIAIVGENGSGKSTLAKIISAIHNIEDGMLFFNGIDINLIQRKTLLEHISIVSQDFVKYPLTVKENILFENEDTNNEKISNLIEKYPMLIPENLKYNLNAMLGYDFSGGQQLSGGQWQKIAISRALVKEADLLILDEPTSALDPMTTNNVINLILSERNSLTTILVTHDLAVAKKFDKILCINNGKIVGFGTHYELIRENSFYKELNNDKKEERLDVTV